MKNIYKALLSLCMAGFIQNLSAQSPGLIVRPAGGNGITSLNPNGDAYSSQTTAGFTTDDISQSELPFKIVPVAISEPTGDLLTGPSAGFTDIVTRVDNSGFYIYKDATNIYFRLRIGGIISGSKGYSVLIDTDNKIGNSGPAADTNYVAPAGTSAGNPGFEYEVVFKTNFEVSVYNIDGTATPGTAVNYSLATHSQISVALSTDNNNPDYFYDWFVPLSAIGNPASIRMAVTTVTSPTSSLQGTRSDIYGINDANFASTSAAWQKVVEAQPGINLASFTGVSPSCTAAPVLNSPITTGSNINVTGTWTRLDATKPSTATITLYKNGSPAGSVTATTGTIWSITASSIANADVFYAKAQSAGESECLQSNNVTASACTSIGAAPTLTCASTKGISGSITAGNSVLIYQVPVTNVSPFTATNLAAGNTTYNAGTFSLYTTNCSGGSGNLDNGTYMVIEQSGSCLSAASFVCISNGSSAVTNLSSNSITLAQPIYGSNVSVKGTGAASGDILRLYINGQYKNSITASASAFSFSGLTLSTGDKLVVYAQNGTSCMTKSATFTVSCYTAAPSITTNTSGNLLTGGTIISGTSPVAGASVQVYKGVFPSGVATGAAVTVSSSGGWSAIVPAMTSGETYYAIQTINSCSSVASSAVTVLTAAACPGITGNYTDANTTVTGTMPSSFTGTIRLYVDGAMAGSQAITTATNWSVTVPANTLYYNASITATAQASGGTESAGCSVKTVGCTSPGIPNITPTSTSINTGQSATFTVSNVTAGNWYALQDNSGSSYATSLYKTSTTGFNLTSKTFSTAGTYSLKLTADPLTGCPATFASASITVNGVLPLFLIDFSGNYMDGNMTFNWSTTGEKNVHHFELQESTDGQHFKGFTTVALQNNADPVHKYVYTSQKLLNAVTYYRLRIIDNDGQEQYSRIIFFQPTVNKKASFKISPNPFNEKLFISFTSQTKGNLHVYVTDVDGRILVKTTRNIEKGENSFEIKDLQRLRAGNYFISLYHIQTGEHYYQKTQKLQ